jgi:hypothetical protein
MNYVAQILKRLIAEILLTLGYVIRRKATSDRIANECTEIKIAMLDLLSDVEKANAIISQLKAVIEEQKAALLDRAKEVEELRVSLCVPVQNGSGHLGIVKSVPDNLDNCAPTETIPGSDLEPIVRFPSVLISTMPKSGTVYLLNKLSEGLDIEIKTVSLGYFPTDLLNVNEMFHFIKGNKISCEHFDPSAANCMILKSLNQRIVVHVRDPRQALVSWIHHMDRMFSLGAITVLLRVCPTPPASYYHESFEKKVDWQIENYLIELVGWAEKWISAVENDASLRGNVLFTSYDELLRDEQSLIQRILCFYGIPEQCYDDQEVKKTMDVHFRKGDPDEWRTVMSEDQQFRVAKLIPSRVSLFFGWQV